MRHSINQGRDAFPQQFIFPETQQSAIRFPRRGPTLDFRIRQLQCFLTLADLLNYGKTARALYMSQPAITFQIKSLEESFNVRLFERDRQQVRLTEAGRTFREYAQTIMNTVEAAQAHFCGLNTRLRLRISCGPVGQFILLPAIIRSLTAAHPDFELEVSELTTEQQMAEMAEGKLDGLLMVGAIPIKGVRFDIIVRESLVAMVSSQNPLAQRSMISVEDLRHTPVIASRLEDCRFHQPFLHDLLAPYDIKPRIVEAPQSCSVQLAYAAADEGIAISSSSMSTCQFPHVVALPFAESLPRLALGLSTLENNNTPAMKIFRKIVMDCAASVFEKRKASIPHRQMPIPQPSMAMLSRREAS
ncbi:MAG: LysR substrate-binding domain-containing protein [Edaphobacter sp.]|nr:LysR substrate-binding domain-containing protein [Edaphobacter sp.]MDE1177980.1 LysR substrate-binding domain-containing protein [Edaphobacter sp.]